MTAGVVLQLTGPEAWIGYGGGLLVVLFSAVALLLEHLDDSGRRDASADAGANPTAQRTEGAGAGAGAGAARTPGDELQPVGQFRYRHREILREHVRLRLVHDLHYAPDEAARLIADGAWTEDEVAAAFVRGDGGENDGAGLLRLLVRSRRRDDDPDIVTVERTIAAVAALDERGEIPSDDADAEETGGTSGDPDSVDGRTSTGGVPADV